jgi:dGTPase
VSRSAHRRTLEPVSAKSAPSDARLQEVRARLEAGEALLAPGAARESTSRGRAAIEAADPLRLDYQRDRDRIIHTRAFRRLKHKTQVFVAPDSDHVVTRMTHTIEVQQIARSIARALGLNEDLTEAIGLGHDLGHTPFGHAGEEALAELLPEGFRHNEQSLRIVDHLERDGLGLNLTYETREGILMHSKTRESVAAEGWGTASTLEGQIVKLADSIAYLNHDFQDAIRAGVLAPADLPADVASVLGPDHSTRIRTLVEDCTLASWEAAHAPANLDGARRITLSPRVLAAVDAFREMMFERVYVAEATLSDARAGQAIVRALFGHYEAHPASIPGWSLPDDPPWRRAADYVSGMTDGYATRVARDLGLEVREAGSATGRVTS